MKKLSYEQIKKYFYKAGVILKDVFVEKLYDEIEVIKRDAYDEAIELGLNRTISALDDANVSDQEIIQIVKDKWSMDENDIIGRLLFVRRTDAIECLKRYLKLQGYSESEVKDFMSKNMATVKIRHEKDLWKLRKNPEKLMKAVMNKTVK